MRTDRLIKLADFLETVPVKSFDIDQWQTKAPTKPEGKKPGGCGFAGCAVGWAAHAKLFRGFRFAPSFMDPKHVQPAYAGRHGFEAVNALFGLKTGTTNPPTGSYGLFVDFAYRSKNPTPKQVAKRIRAFVKNAEGK